jgi:hypothetical protein
VEDLIAMANSNRRSDGCLLAAALIGLILVACSVLVFAPGICIVELLTRFRLDRGQNWCFGILVSILVWLITLYATSKTDPPTAVKRATVAYSVICLAVVAIAAIAHFGLHAVWPVRLLNGVVAIDDHA